MLRFFQQVADGATVTEIAELYQVSQPGVSRGLRRLEEEVGTPLLMRSGRLLRPTHAGSVFKRHVDAMLHALDDGLAAAEELIDPESGTVRVAFQLSLGTWLVPDLIAAFRAEHPRVRFEFEPSHDAWVPRWWPVGGSTSSSPLGGRATRRSSGSGSSPSRWAWRYRPGIPSVTGTRSRSRTPRQRTS